MNPINAIHLAFAILIWQVLEAFVGNNSDQLGLAKPLGVKGSGVTKGVTSAVLKEGTYF